MWLPYQQTAMRELNFFWHIAMVSVYVINVLLALVTSVLTIRLLYFRKSVATNKYTIKRNRSSSLAIFVMNLGNLVFFLILISAIIALSQTVKSRVYDKIGSGYAKFIARRGGYLAFLLFCLIPDGFSVFNPIVFLYFNARARRRILTRMSSMSLTVFTTMRSGSVRQEDGFIVNSEIHQKRVFVNRNISNIGLES